MKIIVFAGGSGKRFWPMSRESFPKQFQPILNNKSTLELQLKNLSDEYGWYNIYFSTIDPLVSLVKNIFPELSIQNIITEPTRRDVGPAVAMSMAKLQKLGTGGDPVAVLWGDSFVQEKQNFLKVLKTAESKVHENPEQFIWLGEKPSFANENIGWIAKGKKLGVHEGTSYYRPAGFKYRPDVTLAKQWAIDGEHLWNTGYFVTTPNFIVSIIEQTNPELAKLLDKIRKAIGAEDEGKVIAEVYPQMPSIHFDHLVLDHLSSDQTLIVEGELGWNDPGTLYAFKQFLEPRVEQNAVKGNVVTHNSKDSLVYNFVEHQLLTAVGIEGLVVVNTPDAILVCPKDKIGEIKDMLSKFKADEKLKKYL